LRKVIISILFLSIIGISWAQKKGNSSNKLEKQRIALLNEIKNTEKRLEELGKSKINSLEALTVLQNKLEARSKLLNNLNRQVASLDNNITNTNDDIFSLKKELGDLKTHYAELVRFSYKNRTAQNFVLFLFSAKSFKDANRRLSYVKQYRNYRAKQAKKIEVANLKLTKKAELLIAKKQDKAQAVNSQQEQTQALEKETTVQNQMVEQFKGQEKTLKKQLVSKKQTAAQLNNAIANAIKREVELARKRAIAEQIRKQKLAAEKKQKEEALALATKRKAEESKRAEIRRKKAEAEAKRIALEKKRLEEERKKAAIAAKKIVEEKKRQEERERKLALEKKRAEEEAKKLADLKKKRQEEERKAKQLAEAKRKKREAELALQKKAEDERARKLLAEKKRQEAQREKLAEAKRRQRESEKQLAREKKRREKEEKRLALEKAKNAKKAGAFLNPRYVPTAAEKEAMARKKAADLKRAKEELKNNYTIALTSEERNLSSNFAANQGKLPWPVGNGYISDHFGKNKHPVFNIYTENYGIDIKTKKGTPAYAIFAGEVSSVIFIPGAGQTVLVNHGSFYTVYSKLKNVSVRKGQKVKLKQVLGSVMTDETGNTKVHFEVWRVGSNGSPRKENPEVWVKRR
jgi:septal ring factor EnvC (AmiA/AmiB activator)